MKNLILNPHLLYLVDTKVVKFSGMIECPKVQIYPKRENVAVLEVSNHFFELEQIKGNGIFLGKELPIREGEKEFIDITSTAFRKFPYEKDFDFKNANLKTLRKAYRNYQIQLGDVSVFGIQKLYQGKISLCEFKKEKCKDPIDEIFLELKKSISEFGTFFLQFEDQSFMLLTDFLEGMHLSGSFLRKVVNIEFDPLEEIPLEELKKISDSRSYKEKKKCLQFPKSNI